MRVILQFTLGYWLNSFNIDGTFKGKILLALLIGRFK
jgi:hypothetical protein